MPIFVHPGAVLATGPGGVAGEDARVGVELGSWHLMLLSRSRHQYALLTGHGAGVAGEAARRVLADPVIVRSLDAVVRAPRVALRR